ncbi:MAG: hypothetical protein AAFY60_20245, partial [Myxococcota bacterium]
SHRVNRVIEELKSLNGPSGSLLDNTVVMWASEFGDGGGHTVQDLPFVFFGGPIRGGHHIDGRGHTHHELLIGLAERFGLPLETLGVPAYLGESFIGSPLSLSP